MNKCTSSNTKITNIYNIAAPLQLKQSKLLTALLTSYVSQQTYYKPHTKFGHLLTMQSVVKTDCFSGAGVPLVS